MHAGSTLPPPPPTSENILFDPPQLPPTREQSTVHHINHTSERGVMSTTKKPLNVLIVGAGIAGLSTAIALRRAGHHVEVFEQSSFADEVGAAIQLPPNAMRSLVKWGFSRDRARLELCGAALTARADTLEPLYRGSFTHFSDKYGSMWYSSHRVDLHNELKLLATQEDASGISVEINLASKVVDIDPKTGTITLAGGSTRVADLVVAASGIHTTFLSQVLPPGQDITPISTGTSAFRFLIPTSDLLPNDEIEPFMKEPGIKIFVGQGSKRLVWYPCRGGEVQNFVGIHPDEEQRREAREIDFQASSSREYLLETYKEFNPVLLRVMGKVTYEPLNRKAQDVKLWPLLHRPPLRTWHTGKLLFIGDAAHPMLPHQGQAGAQAIEDACALGLLLEDTEPTSVNSRLKLFEKVRIGRAGAVQVFSRFGQDQADRVKEEVEKIEGWKGVVPANIGEFHDWNFSWDVYSECQRALDEDRLEKGN
ncbi:MAG: hypothetical protein M1813_000501 [Trichoglossum hirsutum]|nr:MAG: hypothetical protein M1813_000501 [Trichoglossum hirsutum]